MCVRALSVCESVCVRVSLDQIKDRGVSLALAPRTLIYRRSAHRGDLGTACRGHVEVCAAVAQPQSRSTASSTSPLPTQEDQTPGAQPSHTETPPFQEDPKCKSRTRNLRNTRLQREDSEKEDGIPLREFVEVLRGISGLYFLNALVFYQHFVGLILAPHLPQ